MSQKITHLRIYKPDGEILEFEVGCANQEGIIFEIVMFYDEVVGGAHPYVTYKKERGIPPVEAHFHGFPYSYRLENQ